MTDASRTFRPSAGSGCLPSLERRGLVPASEAGWVSRWRRSDGGSCVSVRNLSATTCEVAPSEDIKDLVLNVYVRDKQAFTQVIGGRQWHDLKTDLGEIRGVILPGDV